MNIFARKCYNGHPRSPGVGQDVDVLVVGDGVMDDGVHYERVVADVLLLARANVGVAEVGVHLPGVVAQYSSNFYYNTVFIGVFD